MLVMVVFFIAFRWIHLSTPLITLFLLVLKIGRAGQQDCGHRDLHSFPTRLSSDLYFDSLTVNAGNGGFLHCIQMDTSVNAANQVVSVGADIAFDADPKFF